MEIGPNGHPGLLAQNHVAIKEVAIAIVFAQILHQQLGVFNVKEPGRIQKIACILIFFVQVNQVILFNVKNEFNL